MPTRRTLLPVLVLLTATSVVAQTPAATEGVTLYPNSPLSSVSSWFGIDRAETLDLPPQNGAVEMLRDFKDTDIKFDLNSMMEMLRDHRHEGWVLAVYPDPNTRRPLVGAGFSLDVPARIHLQTDRQNPHPFLEPSSAELWQAAGLAPERLQQILAAFDQNMSNWSARTYRHKIVRQTLIPQLSEEEAEQLLRISAIQAVYNAKAYCRNFDQLTGPQQMALSQLVFQMGVNLEQFVSFRAVLNDPHGVRGLGQLDGYLETAPEHWRTVQTSLMESQWARRYSVRASSVIAMFDPAYSNEPSLAEQRVLAVLRPAVERHTKRRGGAAVRLASYSKRTGKASGRKAAKPRVKRKLA